MLELMHKLIAFKYSCKLNHWSTGSYAQHLLYDRMQEGIDDMVDAIGEKYFMARKDKSIDSDKMLDPSLINLDITKSLKGIIDYIENKLKNDKFSEGINALLSGMSEDLMGRLALIDMK